MNLLSRVIFLLVSVLVWSVLTSPAAWAAGVVGTGTPDSCDGNGVQTALTDGGIVSFNCGEEPHTILANTYVIANDTTILGNNKITLNGENLRQIFIVDNEATLTLQDITLLDGESTPGGCISVNTNSTLVTHHVTFRSCQDTSGLLGGGAVYNLGTFTATETLFESNQANKNGGAVFNRGTFSAFFALFDANTAGGGSGAIENRGDGMVAVNDSTFRGNQAQGGGGGAIGNMLSVPTTAGSLAIRRSLFADNSALTFGGAITNGAGVMTIENSTFARNMSNEGGGIYSTSSAHTTIQFSTFSGNRADTGGAIYRPLTGVVQLGTTILAGSSNEGGTTDQLECDGPPLVSLGYNLIEDDSCVDGSNTTDIRNESPQLGELQDNGGFSLTILPSDTSPALDKVPADQCTARDQRFAMRVGTCDIGATERGGLLDSAYMPRVGK
jgi:predicted outer membrane repeat protein